MVYVHFLINNSIKYMSRTFKLTTTLTNVTSFSGNFDNIVLSGRPQFTDDFRTTLVSGFSASKTFLGYNFSSINSVLLSTTNNINLFNSNYILSSYNFFNEITSVSTNSVPNSSISINYPEVSGFPITTYSINNDNKLTIIFPTVTATGFVDVIIINPAGYGKFSADVSVDNGIVIN